MSDETKTSLPDRTPPGGGGTYGQTDFSESARRSKFRDQRDETSHSRTPPKTPAAPKGAG